MNSPKAKSIIRGLIPFFLFLFLFSTCKDEKEPDLCEAEEITVAVQMIKLYESCKNLESMHDLSFGVTLVFEIDVQCGDNCSERKISYQRRVFHRSENSVVTQLEFGSQQVFRSYHSCDNIARPGMTFLNKVENDPGPIDYALGDTLRIEFINPVLCPTNDNTDCIDDNVPLGLQEFTFEYVLVPEDFDCE